MRVDSKYLEEIWQLHSGKILGGVFGFLFGVLVLAFGFFKTIFIALCVIAGYIIGRKIDSKEDFLKILDKLLPPGFGR